MKTLLVPGSAMLAWLLACAPLCGQVRRVPAANTTFGFPQIPTADLLRRVDGKLVDLRAIQDWKRAGDLAFEARQSFTVPNPLPEWEPILGRVQFVTVDNDVVVNRTGEHSIFLRGWPELAGAQTGTQVWVLARKVGTRNASSAGGGGKTLAIYDYGSPFTAEELAAVAAKEAEERTRKAQAAAAAKKAEMHRKVEAARERAEKARAEREGSDKAKP